jgi:SAM-dependent methyltransferase
MLSLEQQNKLREQYRQMRPGWQPATEVYAGLVQQQCRPSSRLLDIGCGRGGLVEQLGHPLSQVVGVDPDWLSLRQHRLALPRVVAFSDDLPLAAGQFDVAFASWVLEHLAEPGRTLAAIGRVLRPGGAFVFITPNGRHPLTWLNHRLGQFKQIQGRTVEWLYGRAADDTFSTFYRANSEKMLKTLCLQNGLVLETLCIVPDPTYLAFNPALFHLMCRLEERLPAARHLHLVGLARRP